MTAGAAGAWLERMKGEGHTLAWSGVSWASAWDQEGLGSGAEAEVTRCWKHLQDTGDEAASDDVLLLQRRSTRSARSHRHLSASRTSWNRMVVVEVVVDDSSRTVHPA